MLYQFLDDDRKKLNTVGTYNNKFLDDFLCGIDSEDFILIGADTGVGKSEMAIEIAFHNSLNKNVHLFALEAEENEPYYRKMFKMIATDYYNDKNRVGYIEMNYRNFRKNLINVDKYIPSVLKDLERFNNLTVHYRDKEFTINTLIEKINKAVNEFNCDMIVLDHIDYFDLHPGVNENFQVSEIMKALRALNQDNKIPIVVISHLRKKANKKQLMPDIDDFMGTSNKAKQAKTVILISPDYSTTDFVAGKYGTFFMVPKARVGGGERIVCRMIYDRTKNGYEQNYELLYLKNFGEECEAIPQERWPKWAKSQIYQSPLL